MLAIGNQRSYSDICVSNGEILRAGDVFSFDMESDGLTVTAEAGATLGAIIKSMPRGWRFPVVPGTSHATIGGCIANDVHGKNHVNQGAFGNHVLRIVLQNSDGRLAIYPKDDLFCATVGGLGLTGFILQATIELESGPRFEPWLFPLDYIPYYWPIYRRLGFWQYHCVVPPRALEFLYKQVTQRPLLIVRKTFGAWPPIGMLSFCRPGISISMDFVKPDPAMMAQLDNIVIDCGGAVYPAKTSMSAKVFRASFPRWQEFQRYIDPAFSSSFSQRVGLTSDSALPSDTKLAKTAI